MAQVVGEAVAGGASMVQLRDKFPLTLDRRSKPSEKSAGFEAFALMLSVLNATSASAENAMVWVHGGREAAGICAEIDFESAAGVHVPERPLPGFSLPPNVARIREEHGGSLLISRSVHSIEAALQAERGGADMLVLGTVFPSTSHPGGATIGVEGVRAACDSVRIPVIAIGGITARNASGVMRAGASGVAVISAIFDALDPRAAAAELRAAIDEAWKER